MKLTTIAEGKKFAIEKFDVTESWVNEQKMISLAQFTIHEHYDMKAGTYTRLFDKELQEVVMSDAPMERRTNVEVLERARGHVLIAGLGIGMILRPILDSQNVKTVTVVEKYAEVIDLNMLSGFDINHSKLRLVTADIFDYQFVDAALFDVIYFDIWNGIGQENKKGMDELHDRFKKHLKPGGWMESWRREDCQPEISQKTKDFYRRLIQKNPAVLAILAGSIGEPGFKCGGFEKS